MTMFMWCSTSTTVSSKRSRRSRITSPRAATSLWVSPLAGSSSISSLGCDASARASSIRLSVPYGSPAAGCSARWASSRRSSSSKQAWRTWRSWPGTGGSRVAEVTKPPRLREWAPTITLSSTERPGNSARFWKVRVTPSWAMR